MILWETLRLPEVSTDPHEIDRGQLRSVKLQLLDSLAKCYTRLCKLASYICWIWHCASTIFARHVLEIALLAVQWVADLHRLYTSDLAWGNRQCACPIADLLRLCSPVSVKTGEARASSGD